MKTLGLNMIVGPNDADNLNRCLESFDAKNFFDQIVIVTTTNDEKVREVAIKFGADIYDFKWTSERFPYGDFAGARNVALKHTDTNYVMWVDCDDVVEKKSEKGMTELKQLLEKSEYGEISFYATPYLLNADRDDKPTKVLKRERIFKVDKEVHWHYPVHEQLIFPEINKNGYIRNFIIEHKMDKPHEASVSRNLKILEHEKKLHDEGKDSEFDRHLKFYYAHELLNISKLDKDKEKGATAMKLFDEILKDRENGSKSNKAHIAITLAMEHAYGKQEAILIQDKTHKENKVDPKDLQKAEMYARICQSYSTNFAEADVILGDVYLYKNRINIAINFYKQAMTRSIGTFDVQNVFFYEEIPARRLMELCSINGEPEISLFYSSKYLKHVKNEPEVYDLRKEQLMKIMKGDEEMKLKNLGYGEKSLLTDMKIPEKNIKFKLEK